MVFSASFNNALSLAVAKWRGSVCNVMRPVIVSYGIATSLIVKPKFNRVKKSLERLWKA